MLVPDERIYMIREAAEEAAEKTRQLLSAEFRLLLAQSDARNAENVNRAINENFKHFLGMTSAEHIQAHKAAADAVTALNDVYSTIRKMIVTGIMGAVIVFGGWAIQNQPSQMTIDVPHAAIIKDEGDADGDIQTDNTSER